MTENERRKGYQSWRERRREERKKYREKVVEREKGKACLTLASFFQGAAV